MSVLYKILSAQNLAHHRYGIMGFFVSVSNEVLNEIKTKLGEIIRLFVYVRIERSFVYDKTGWNTSNIRHFVFHTTQIGWVIFLFTLYVVNSDVSQKNVWNNPCVFPCPNRSWLETIIEVIVIKQLLIVIFILNNVCDLSLPCIVHM